MYGFLKYYLLRRLRHQQPGEVTFMRVRPGTFPGVTKTQPNKPVEDNDCSAFADCMFMDFRTVLLQPVRRLQQPCLT